MGLVCAILSEAFFVLPSSNSFRLWLILCIRPFFSKELSKSCDFILVKNKLSDENYFQFVFRDGTISWR
jgi:hypothetical protein